MIILLTGCSEAKTDCDTITTISISEDSVKNNESIEEDEEPVDNEGSSNITNNDKNDIQCGDKEIDSVIKNEIALQNDEEIEYAEWIDTDNTIYRVGIKRLFHDDTEYDHLRDYFFINNGEVISFVVEYPSKKEFGADRYVNECCNFEASYEDVNFDGNKDIIIFLGYSSSASCWYYCAYLYENDGFRYEKTFEAIPSFEIDNVNKIVTGRYVSGGETYYPKYEFKDGIFVKVSE